MHLQRHLSTKLNTELGWAITRTSCHPLANSIIVIPPPFKPKRSQRFGDFQENKIFLHEYSSSKKIPYNCLAEIIFLTKLFKTIEWSEEMRLKINNVSHGVGRYNSAKCWQVLLYLPSPQIHKCPFRFSRDKLIQVLSSQEVITESRWTLSHLVFLGTEARLHCRYVLHFSTASQPGQERSCPMPTASF